MVCKNNPFIFFGKPVIKLSNYQLELFSSGSRFKNIIEQKGKTPPPLSTLSESVKFYEESYNALGSDKKDETNLGRASSIVGADAEEMKTFAENEGGKNVINLTEAAQKKQEKKGGGPLTMMDMIEIHGE